jgi:CHASE2 domain-containing sensor protein
MELVLTPQTLVAFLAALLAVLFDWLPGLKTWFDKKTEGQKRGIMALLLLIVVALVFGLGCFNLIVTGWVCTVIGVQAALMLLLEAIAINQGVHFISKPSK